MNVNSKPRVLKIKVKEWLENTTSLFKKADIPSAQLDAELLLCNALNVGREWLITHSEDEISADTAKEAVKKRLNRKPIAYIRGWKEFYKRRFTVNSSVLIPRPESEQIIELLKEIVKNNQKIVDIGTGSGALAITTALEFPNSSVDACDISKSALKIAKHNAKNLKANVTFLESDLLLDINGTYDIILANLPYVDKSWQRSPETEFEPSIALFAKDNGLDLIKKLVIQTQEKLQKDGFLLLEADPRQHQSIINFAKEYGFSLYKKQDFIVALKK